MDGIIIILLFVSTLFLLFLWRLWTYLSRHPLIRLLYGGVTLVVTLDAADDHGQPLHAPRSYYLYLKGSPGERRQ